MAKKTKPVKKATTKKVAHNARQVAKKAPVKKAVVKKASPKKVVAKPASPKGRKAIVKKAVKKAAPKKVAAKKPTHSALRVAKKAVVKKPVAKKTIAIKKLVPVKTAPAKVAIKKAVAKKIVVKKKAAPVVSPILLPDATVENAANINTQMMVPGDGLNEAPVKTEDPVKIFDKNVFNKATAKGDPHSNMHFSSKPKNAIKPSGKKPLW